MNYAVCWTTNMDLAPSVSPLMVAIRGKESFRVTPIGAAVVCAKIFGSDVPPFPPPLIGAGKVWSSDQPTPLYLV